MKIKRVDHIAFAVNDVDGWKTIFNDLFDISVKSDEERNRTRIVMMGVGDTNLEFLSTDDQQTRTGQWLKENGPGFFHLCLEVDDLLSSMAELRQKGVKFLNETPITGHAQSQVAFINPACTGGLLLELMQPANSSA